MKVAPVSSLEHPNKKRIAPGRADARKRRKDLPAGRITPRSSFSYFPSNPPETFDDAVYFRSLHTHPPPKSKNHVGVPSSSPVLDICPRVPAPGLCYRCLPPLTSALSAPPFLLLLVFGTNGFWRSPSLAGGGMLDGIGGLHG